MENTDKPTENPSPEPPKLIKCGKKTYSEEVLEKKRELARQALKKANDMKREKMRQQVKEEVKQEIEQSKAPKQEEVKPPPIVSRKPREAKAQYISESDTDSNDSDHLVLVKKKMVKKYKELKKQSQKPPEPTHELTDKALLERWHREKYQALFKHVFGN